MSFFKKMTKEFDELKGSLFKDEDKKDKEKKEETHQGGGFD